MPNFIQLTTPLILHADPILPMHAATKRYVDNRRNSINASAFTTGVITSARMPALTGDVTSAAGSGVISLNTNGVTAGTYTKVTVDAKGRVTAGGTLTAADIATVSWVKITSGKPTTAAGYGITNLISLSGGTVSGNVVSSAIPSASLHAVTKGYVDNAITGVVSASLSAGDVLRKTLTAAPSGFLRCNGSVVSRATYPALFSLVGTGYNKPTSPSSNGRPWAMQHDFNTSQTGEITPWVTTIDDPAEVSFVRPAFTTSRVYSFFRGGVITASVSNTGVIGTWSTTTPLPASILPEFLVVLNGRLYLLVCRNPSTNLDLATMYYSTIAGDGTLGAWTTQSGPSSRDGNGILLNYQSATAFNNKIYLNRSDINYSIQNTTIATDVLNFNIQGQYTGLAMQGASFSFGSIANGAVSSSVIKSKFYCFYVISSEGSFRYNSADILGDGTLGPFTSSTQIPLSNGLNSNDAGSPVIATDTRVYILRASNDSSRVNNNFYTADVDTGGNVTNWRTEAVNPFIINFQQAFLSSNRLFMFDGVSYTFGSTQTVHVSVVNANGTLATSTSSSTPETRPQAILVSNKVHIFGSRRSVASSSITTGTVNTNGTLQPVVVNGVSKNFIPNGNLPASVGNAQVVVTKGRVYLLGGLINYSVSSTVYTASIAVDGTVGAWATGISLPANLHNSHAVMTSNRVYLLGGNNGTTGVATVYSAFIDSDGVLSSWTTNTPLGITIERSQAVVIGSRVYLLGGFINGTISSAVYTAPIATDGTIGAFSLSAISLPTNLHSAQAVVTRNRLYLFGGFTSAFSWNVYSTPVNVDGTLGTWQFNQILTPTSNYSYLCFQPIVTSSMIYLLGSDSNGFISYSSAFSGGFNDYTNYLAQITTPATDFTLPDFTSLEKNRLNYFIKT